MTFVEFLNKKFTSFLICLGIIIYIIFLYFNDGIDKLWLLIFPIGSLICYFIQYLGICLKSKAEDGKND